MGCAEKKTPRRTSQIGSIEREKRSGSQINRAVVRGERYLSTVGEFGDIEIRL